MNCPTCKAEFATNSSDSLPFCSQRCRSIDLGRWLDEENSLPHVPDPEDDEQPEQNSNAQEASAAKEEAR